MQLLKEWFGEKNKIFINFQWIPYFISNPLNIFLTLYLFHVLFQKAFLSTFSDDFC